MRASTYHPCNYFPTTEWEAIDPEKVKLDKQKIIEIDAVIRKEYGNTNGILVTKNGYIAFERYYNGYGSDDAHHLTSVTKSVLSALIGIAIERNYIKSIDQRILDFFPEYNCDSSEDLKGKITIRHLLTMTAPYAYQDWREPIDKMCMQADWSRYVLDIIGLNGVIGNFKYSTAGAHLLSVILTRASGKTAREFANEYLFKFIGIKEIPDHKTQGFEFEDLFGSKVTGWVKDPSNNSIGGWGLTLTPREMARFGILYINQGKWNEKVIVSQNWINESTSPHSEVVIDGSSVEYGYLWWLRNDEEKAYLAMGDGGNVICCIPERSVVIAISSGFTNTPNDRWELITRHIAPIVAM